MSGNTNYIDQVGAFLDNELSGEDLANFNAELAINPALVKELDFQKELIEGIKEYRKTELKARLNDIPVSTALWYGTPLKIITGILVTAGIGYGIFELMQGIEPKLPEDQQVKIVEVEPIRTDEPEAITNKHKQEMPEKTGIIAEEQLNKEELQDKDINKKEKSIAVPSAPKVLTPESFGTEQVTEDDLEIPETSLGSKNEPLESQLEIEIISNKRKYPFHYQVNEGRLLLYGDFDEEPYELLEISINAEKKLYLFFKDKYYEIEETASEATPLQPVSNDSLIRELEKLKNKDS